MVESAQDSRAKEGASPAVWSAPMRYAICLLSTAASFFIRLAFDPILGNRYPFTLFILAILAASWFGGLGPAIVALLLGYVIGDWFFAAPRYEFGLEIPDQIGLVIYCVVGLGVGGFGYVVREKQRHLRAEQAAQRRLAETAREQMKLLERAHAALRRSEEQLRLVIDLVPHSIFAKDAQGRFLFVNRALAELNGKRPEDMVGRTDSELAMDKVQAEQYRRDDLAVLESRAPKVIPAEILTDAGGGRRTLHTTKIPFTVAETGELAVLGVAVDITERQQTELALRKGQEELERALAFDDAVMSNMGEGLYTVDTEGRVTFMNPAAERMFGWTLAELRGRKMHDATHYKHRNGSPFPAAECAGLQVLREGRELRDFEDVFVRKDGSFFDVIYSASPLHESGRISGLVVVFRDITERRQQREKLEGMVAERTARLREAINELEGFSYSIAHDMRAPLRSMQGFARILSDDYTSQLDATGQDYLRRIMTSATRMDRLIVDVLNYSKVVRGELNLQPVDVDKLVHEVIASYPATQGSHADIHVETPLPMVLANEAALTQVVSNLLGNAVKFVAPGVRPKVRVRAEAIDGGVRLWFEDNGIGIPKDSQARLFQMFHRLNPADHYEGTGIGLAIVRKAVERMGGKVGVESEPNAGSRFWVQLQRA